MKIDIQVPEDLRSLPTFQKCLLEAHEELSAPGAIKTVCIHETGHLVYFRLAGLPLGFTLDDFWVVGPTITYRQNDEMEYEFEFNIAATRTPFQEASLDYTDETLLALAKAAFAGGVFVHELDNGSLRGDTDDRERFRRYYNRAIKQRGQMDRLESQLRLLAIDAVTADLKNEAVREQALLKAGQVEAELFS